MYNSVVSNPNPTVNFYLGHSKKKAQRLSYSDSDNSASSTDSESDSDDKYYNVDADNYSGHFYSDDIPLQSSFQSHVHLSNHTTSVEAIDIYESCNYNNNNNNINIENYIPVVTPPNTYNKSSFNSIIKPTNINHSQSSIKSIIQKATTIDNVGQVSYSYESIAMLTKAISQRSLPPTPPRCFSQSPQSPQSPSPSAEFSNYTFTNDHPSFEYCPIFPSSILNSFDDSVNHNIKITPQTPCENKLIPINLEPVSPISLANDIKDSDIDCLDLDCAIYDEYNHDSRCNGASSNSCLQASFDTQLPDEITVSPEFLVGYEQDIISQLNLEEDDRIIDKFRIRPLLADGNRPFIPCSPVYASVEELFAKLYPDLVPGTRQYIWHLNRLERNRTKLRDLSQCIDRYDQVRRKRLSQSRSKEDKRFRARR